VQPASQLPSERQVLVFITETIDWYRQLPANQRIGSGAAIGIVNLDYTGQPVLRQRSCRFFRYNHRRIGRVT
jgi:hypothetical protein